MTTTDPEIVVLGRGIKQRPRVVRWFTDGGLSTFVFMLPLLLVFGLFSFCQAKWQRL